MNASQEKSRRCWRNQWRLREDTTYLNHGSFGPSPEPVRAEQLRWQQRFNEQPMDFFVRHYEDAWQKTLCQLAEFIGNGAENLVLVENSTWAMNVVADSINLQAGDEVVVTDHEYGAVLRIWQRACRRAGAAEPIVAQLPLPVETSDQFTDALLAKVTKRTRLIVVSHITSPTAVTMPVEEIGRAARARNVALCIDGPHAVAQLPLDLDRLGCDYYTASCHKWLCAPFGSGFLYVHPEQHGTVQSPILSWGRLRPHRPTKWSDEFIWSGTRDPSAFLSIPAAIDFLRQVGLDEFRATTHQLARYAREQLAALTGNPPLTPDSRAWYGSMVNVPLPPGEALPLQQALWQRYRIEVPIITWHDQRYIRVSCHLYTQKQDIDYLVEALGKLLAEPPADP